MKAFLIAGTHSGVGKTTITAGLLNYFIQQKIKTTAFKVGPDYIDPGFHQKITGRPGCNLDSFFHDSATLEHLFYEFSRGSEMAIVEGVMGLYDGLGSSDVGSTASVAKKLDLPVILVLDACALSRSVAAMINGYAGFDKTFGVAGVILNRVSGEKHYQLLKENVIAHCSVPLVGYVNMDVRFTLKSRHLGLIPSVEVPDFQSQLNMITEQISKTIDMKKLLEIGSGFQLKAAVPPFKTKKLVRPLRIAVAMDKAFHFYYAENLALMNNCGLEPVFFSPLSDSRLPENIDGCFIGGGFPEVFAKKLAGNRSLLRCFRCKLEQGLPVYAECGGLMYLTEGIIDKEKKFHKMIGFFKTKIQMTDRLKRFGYVHIDFQKLKLKGHEFHHSQLMDCNPEDFIYQYQVTKASREERWQCGLRKKNCLAAYAHVHFYGNPDFFTHLIHFFGGRYA